MNRRLRIVRTLFGVLAPDGEYLGNTRWPTTLSNARVSRGHLLVIVTDPESDEPTPTDQCRGRPKLHRMPIRPVTVLRLDVSHSR